MITVEQRIEKAAAASVDNQFSTAVAKKDALDHLNRAYEIVRRAARDEQTDRLRAASAGDDELYFAGLRKLIELPFNLNQYRDAKHAGCFMGNVEPRSQVLALSALRDKIKAMPVVKVETKAQREQAILARSEIPNIAAEFNLLKPGIIEDYKKQVEASFALFLGKYENDWVVIANRRGFSTYDYQLWDFLRQHLVNEDVDNTNRYAPKKIDEDRLNKLAIQYADDQVAGFVHKLSLKLVDLKNVKLSKVQGYSFVIRGNLPNGDTVGVVQNLKYNTSKYGVPFIQWPALISVNGASISELDFQNLVGN